MPKKPDRRTASTDVRLELRRQMLLLREQGKTHVEIAQITGYTRSYVSTILRRLEDAPEMLERMSRGGRPTGSKVFLILDNLNVHQAKPVRDWLAEHDRQIKVFYMPPYSPELNATEYFNGDMKREIQRGIPPKDVKDLKRTLLSQSRRIQKSPARVRAYLRNEPIQYAA